MRATHRMHKTTFRISYRPDGKWQGTKDREEPPIVISHTQALVKEEVFEQARVLGHSRVLVYNGRGEEEEERSFGAPRLPKAASTWE